MHFWDGIDTCRWNLYVYICCYNLSLSSSKGVWRGRNPKCPMERATLIIAAFLSYTYVYFQIRNYWSLFIIYICTRSSKSEDPFNKDLCFRLVVSGHLQKEADFFSNFIEGERGIKEFCNQVTNTTSFRLNVYCLSYPLKLDRVYTLDCLDMKVHTLVIDEIRWWKINTRKCLTFNVRASDWHRF